MRQQRIAVQRAATQVSRSRVHRRGMSRQQRALFCCFPPLEPLHCDGFSLVRFPVSRRNTCANEQPVGVSYPYIESELFSRVVCACVRLNLEAPNQLYVRRSGSRHAVVLKSSIHFLIVIQLKSQKVLLLRAPALAFPPPSLCLSPPHRSHSDVELWLWLWSYRWCKYLGLGGWGRVPCAVLHTPLPARLHLYVPGECRRCCPFGLTT